VRARQLRLLQNNAAAEQVLTELASQCATAVCARVQAECAQVAVLGAAVPYAAAGGHRAA